MKAHLCKQTPLVIPKFGLTVFIRALQIIYPIIAGLGTGGLFYPPLIYLQAAMPAKDMATTTATLGLLRQLGSTVGIAVGQAIWSTVSLPIGGVIVCNALMTVTTLQELRKKLALVSGVTIDTSSANLADSIRQINLIEASLVVNSSRLSRIDVIAPQPLSLRREVQHAYTKSVAMIWIVDTPIVGLCLILGTHICHHLQLILT